MDEHQIKSREERLRSLYPQMFNHEGGRPNESWLGDWPVRWAQSHVDQLHNLGYASVRMSECTMEGWHSLFVDVREAIVVDGQTEKAGTL